MIHKAYKKLFLLLWVRELEKKIVVSLVKYNCPIQNRGTPVGVKRAPIDPKSVLKDLCTK